VLSPPVLTAAADRLGGEADTRSFYSTNDQKTTTFHPKAKALSSLTSCRLRSTVGVLWLGNEGSSLNLPENQANIGLSGQKVLILEYQGKSARKRV
jgi:hypothetical protein